MSQTVEPVPLPPAFADEPPHLTVTTEVPANTQAVPAPPIVPAPTEAPVRHLPVNVTLIRKSLLDEIMTSRGVDPNGRLRDLVEPLVARSIDRFVQMMAEVDRLTATQSFFEAARWMLPHFARGVEVIGAESVPADGPVLFVSNHPGNFDEVVIAANVSRPDLRIFANSHPILTQFPAISRHAVFSKANDPLARMNALRSGIRNLRQGSSLLIFPTGRTDPDPRRIAGAGEAIENWSPSVELIVNKAPETQVVVTLVSGVVSRPILNNPLLRLRKQQLERQKLAGTIQ
ncbi:MAG: lysophospholipid acyltransferase family protein, partial [Caldilineaceae bacterium]